MPCSRCRRRGHNVLTCRAGRRRRRGGSTRKIGMHMTRRPVPPSRLRRVLGAVGRTGLAALLAFAAHRGVSALRRNATRAPPRYGESKRGGSHPLAQHMLRAYRRGPRGGGQRRYSGGLQNRYSGGYWLGGRRRRQAPRAVSALGPSRFRRVVGAVGKAGLAALLAYAAHRARRRPAALTSIIGEPYELGSGRRRRRGGIAEGVPNTYGHPYR